MFCGIGVTCTAKTLKKTILTSVWSAQHPNAGRNIQHLCIKETDNKLLFKSKSKYTLINLYSAIPRNVFIACSKFSNRVSIWIYQFDKNRFRKCRHLRLLLRYFHLQPHLLLLHLHYLETSNTQFTPNSNL